MHEGLAATASLTSTFRVAVRSQIQQACRPTPAFKMIVTSKPHVSDNRAKLWRLASLLGITNCQDATNQQADK